MMIDAGLLVLLLPAVVGAVQFVKDCGVGGNVLRVASLVIGSVLAMAALLLDIGAARAVLTCLLVGLGACGLYDLSKLVGLGSNGAIVTDKITVSSEDFKKLVDAGIVSVMDSGKAK